MSMLLTSVTVFYLELRRQLYVYFIGYFIDKHSTGEFTCTCTYVNPLALARVHWGARLGDTDCADKVRR